MRRYVIVGSGIAGLSAAESIRREDPGAKIALVSREPHPFYSRPGLAYLLTGEAPEARLRIRTPEEVRALGIDRIQADAARLHPAEHALALAGGRTLRYDRLLLATGAASLPPDFPGNDLEGVVRLDDLEDARTILRLAHWRHTAVVVGGGSTALEIVEGLAARGVRTHYFLRGDRYWSRVLDPVESAIVEGRLEAEGVVIHRHTAVARAHGRWRRLRAVETAAGETVRCGILAVAIGVRPRIELARGAGVETERGILTDAFLETSAADVFAAGDAAQVRDPVTGEARLDTLWPAARAQGEIAGRNMAGARVAYRNGVPFNVTRLAGITTTVIGEVGGEADPDLVTITRGQSERWLRRPDAWELRRREGVDRMRLVLGAREIVGAVVMGDQTLSRPLARLVQSRADISAIRPALEAHPDQAGPLLLEFCRRHEALENATDARDGTDTAACA